MSSTRDEFRVSEFPVFGAYVVFSQPQMRLRASRGTTVLGVLLAGCTLAFALNPSLQVSQYAHNSWTVRNGFSLGNIYAMAQTPDGYLWFGTEFGLFRFDGVTTVRWQPPAGQHLPDKNINSLLVTRDGALWIGTFAGLASWSGGKLTQHPELDGQFVASLIEDREGTVWASSQGNGTPPGRLCAIGTGSAKCYGDDGSFGDYISALYEDSSGTLWAGAQSGLWKIKPGPPRRFGPLPTKPSALNRLEDSQLLIALYGAGLSELVGDKIEPYPIRDAINSKRLLPDREVNSNKLLRDHDGGLWIGTVERGLIHLHSGRMDVFSQANGLSGDVVLSLFEDREGNIWAATTGGLDRFRELPVTTISVKQGLSSDATHSVLAATDGGIWIGAHDGLTRWKDGQITVFLKASGLPDDLLQSLYQDGAGRIWASTRRGLAYFKDARFVGIDAVPDGEVYSITGDKEDNLWLSLHQGLFHLLDGHLVEQIPWPELGRHEQAKVLLYDRGGLWLGFWTGGGVSYFKDAQLRASYTAANGLGQGHVPSLQLNKDGALWVATQDGGLSRLKDGHIITLSSRNGLPCDSIHWEIQDDDRSIWLYTTCGLVRISRTELDAWIADPKRRIQTTVWDSADGVRLRSSAVSAYGPPVAKSTDGKLWFVTGEGVQVVAPNHLAVNKLPPPVHIEQIVADHQIYWQNLSGAPVSLLRLPALIRDLTIDYTALSLVAPDKVHFKYKLEGQDCDWREVVNDREVQYSNLRPRTYTFRVIACNNSGVWNEQGDTLEFSVAPAYYQTNWFRALCAACVLAVLWALYQFRVRQVRQEVTIGLEAKISERTRIARDLHDTLLQSFHGLLFRFQAARNMLPGRPEEAVQELDSALIRAEQALDEGRQSIQELRSGVFPENDLDQMMIAIGQELASSPAGPDGSPNFKVIVEGERRGLYPITKEEILRIARELLQNAFRHARARAIEAEIRYEPSVFRLVVRDDGKGIDSKILKDGGRAGHWGMPGVRERARGIGARLEFWSEAGAGTEVRLTLRADIAYESSGNGARFRLFRKWRIHGQQS